MGIALQPYTEDRIPAVVAFNERLAQGGCPPEFRFPESSTPHWLPKRDGLPLFQEYYLAIENEFVRGGFILKYQDFALRGHNQRVVYYHLPLSEGIINRAYATTGALMLRGALKMQPVLFALGMGGFDNPLPTMLKAMGWSLLAVPFYFRVNQPARFLRNVAALRSSFSRLVLSNIAAVTGTGWVGIKVAQSMRTVSAVRDITIEPVNTSGVWADELWQTCAPLYAMIGNRESSVLNCLYPPGKNFLAIKVLRSSQAVGWAVLLDTQMHDNKYFGNLRVGTLVDCLAVPENAPAVIQAACDFLTRRGVDLIICNHSQAAWGNAFRSSGFFSGPSNFIFAASKPLAQQLDPISGWQNEIFFMRGDGDGPVNL
jgi:hypothetical protein